MSYQHLGFDLLDGLQYNTTYDDDGCSAEGYIGTKISIEENRDQCNDAKTNCADEDDISKNRLKIICGGLARTNAGDKAALLLHIIGDLHRIKGDRCIEVGKEHCQCQINDQTDGILPVIRITPVILTQAIKDKTSSSSWIGSHKLLDDARELE